MMPWEQDFETSSEPVSSTGVMPWEQDFEQGGSGRGTINPAMVNPNAPTPKAPPAPRFFDKLVQNAKQQQEIRNTQGLAFGQAAGKGFSLGLSKYLPGYNPELEQKYPGASMMGNAVGGVVNAALTSGGSIPTQIGLGALTGGIQGYTQKESNKDAAIGAAIGAGAAGIPSVLSYVGGKAGDYIARSTTANKIEELIKKKPEGWESKVAEMFDAFMPATPSQVLPNGQISIPKPGLGQEFLNEGKLVSKAKQFIDLLRGSTPLSETAAGKGIPMTAAGGKSAIRKLAEVPEYEKAGLLSKLAKSVGYGAAAGAGGAALNQNLGQPFDPSTAVGLGAATGAAFGAKKYIGQKALDVATKKYVERALEGQYAPDIYSQLAGRLPAQALIPEVVNPTNAPQAQPAVSEEQPVSRLDALAKRWRNTFGD